MEELEMKKLKENYDSSPTVLKRFMVLEMLGTLKERGEIFENFHKHISDFPDNVIESELDEIFRIVLVGIYMDTKEKLEESKSQLQEMKDVIQRMREQEQEEKSKENLGNKLEEQFLAI